MSGFERHALKTLVAENSRSAKLANANEVWNLNLDQIESDTGRVLAKQMVSTEMLGPSTYPFEAGTVLYSKLRPYLNKVVVADDAGVATTELVPLRCNLEKLLPQYLAYFLRSPEFLQFANVVVAGAKMPRMVMGEFWDYKIPVPPLPEQRRIAAILDQADVLRAKRREALAQLDELQKAIFIEMFGDPISNSKNMPLTTLGEATKFENGDRSSNYPSGDDIQESGILFLSTKNIRDKRLDLSTTSFITEEKFKSLSRGKARKGDVLITLRGTLGSCCIFDCKYDTAFINAQMMIIRTNDGLRPEYLHALLTSGQFQDLFSRIGQGAAVPQLTATQLGQLAIPIPPVADQNCFVEKIEAASILQQEQEVHMSWLDSLFASLQQRAFRGEL